MKKCDCHNLPMVVSRRSHGRDRWYCPIKLSSWRKSGDANKASRQRALVDAEIEARGSQCQWPGCGWSATLEWHHIRDKEFSISDAAKPTGSTRYSLERIKAELAKCDLLCPNHHSLADKGIPMPEPPTNLEECYVCYAPCTVAVDEDGTPTYTIYTGAPTSPTEVQ